MGRSRWDLSSYMRVPSGVFSGISAQCAGTGWPRRDALPAAPTPYPRPYIRAHSIANRNASRDTVGGIEWSL